MWRYLGKRILQFIPVIFAVAILIFYNNSTVCINTRICDHLCSILRMAFNLWNIISGNVCAV